MFTQIKYSDNKNLLWINIYEMNYFETYTLYEIYKLKSNTCTL